MTASRKTSSPPFPKSPRLLVIARNSTFTYKGKPVKVKQVSEELGVRYVLEGSVQRSGDRVRITAQLIDALTGHHLWAERYERDLKDLFALQDEVTTKILTAMAVKLTEGEQAAIVRKTFQGEARSRSYLKVMEWHTHYATYVPRGQQHGSADRRGAGGEVSRESLELSCLGWVHRVDLMIGTTKSPQESLEKAMELVQKALAMDDSISNAHGLLSSIYSAKREYDKAIAEGERAVALEPSGADAHVFYGHESAQAGRTEEAIPIFQKAIRLNPYGSASSFVMLGNAYARTGRFEEAVSAYKKALLRGAVWITRLLILVWPLAYIALGREKEARAEAAEVLRINPKFSLDNFAKSNAWKGSIGNR